MAETRKSQKTEPVKGEMRCKNVAGKEHMEDAVRLNTSKGTD